MIRYVPGIHYVRESNYDCRWARGRCRVIGTILSAVHGIQCGAFSTTRGLSKTYREISDASNCLQRWPDSKKFCDDCLVYDDEFESYNLPSFHDGHGPLGVFGFLHRNDGAKSIMAACDEIFNQFCCRIRDEVLDGDQDQQVALARWILQSPPTSHHISVAILQEHPTFLRNQADLEKWQPISDSTILHLASSFATYHPLSLSECPSLELDSLLWTPDGAMIAGFIDSSPGQGFEKLRQSSRTIARDTLGDVLTTRPKNLIHATVGRVVGLPPGATECQYKSLTDLASEYNRHILPNIVNQIRAESEHCGTFTLEELSLARNTVWMLHEYLEYASWPLTNNKQDK
jgi:hypothetical protein